MTERTCAGIQALYGPAEGYEGGGGGGPLPSEPEWIPSGGRGVGGGLGDLLRCCGLMWRADYTMG